MNTPNNEIVGADGKPITTGIALNDVQRLEKMKADVQKLMDDPKLQDYAAVMVLGTQLYAWAHHSVITTFDADKQVKQLVIDTLIRSLYLPDGNPRPFAVGDMHKNVVEMLPFIEKQIGVQIKAAKDHDKVMKEMVEKVLTAKSTEVTKENEPCLK